MALGLSWAAVRGTLTGVAVSIPITIFGALIGFPLAFYSAPLFSFGPLGFFAGLAFVPILCNIFVWRAYMSHSSRATQISLLATGVILSFAFAVLIFMGLFFALISDA